MWRGEKSRTHKTQEEKHGIERERERDRARELHAIRITSKFHNLVMSYFFFAELMAARFMHILGLSIKRCLRVKGEKQQNIQHNFLNCLAVEQDARVTCKLTEAMKTNVCFKEAGRQFLKAPLPVPSIPEAD